MQQDILWGVLPTGKFNKVGESKGFDKLEELYAYYEGGEDKKEAAPVKVKAAKSEPVNKA